MSNDDSDIIFQSYKLSSVILPEKNTRSLDEIYKHLYPQSNLQKSESSEQTKNDSEKIGRKASGNLCRWF